MIEHADGRANREQFTNIVHATGITPVEPSRREFLEKAQPTPDELEAKAAEALAKKSGCTVSPYDPRVLAFTMVG
jgi:hypothetical protein